MFLLFFSLSVVLMWRMACRWVAVHWTLRLAQVLVWYFKPISPTVSAASLSFTALTQTSTSRQKPCPATRPLPATCEYFTLKINTNKPSSHRPPLHAAFDIVGLLSWIWGET